MIFGEGTLAVQFPVNRSSILLFTFWMPLMALSARAELGLFPVGAYAPETGAVAGAYAQWVKAQDSLRRPDQLAAWLTLAVRGQAEGGLRPEWWGAGNGWNAAGELSYQLWPASWHGVGPHSPASTQDFTAERGKVEAVLRRQWAPGLYGGVCGLQVREHLRGPATLGELAHASGRDTGLGLELALDTRDDTVWPRRGYWLQVRGLRHASLVGGDWDYSRWLGDGRVYGEMAGGVLATQVVVEGRGGQVSPRALPKLSEWLRAVDELRFVDRWAGALRVEWRQDLPFTLPTRLGKMLAERSGWVFFAEGGQVAERPGALTQGAMAWSLGLGGRFALLPEERLNARADLAFGKEGVALRIKVGEEF